MNRVGNNIKRLRLDHRLTQEQLAEQLSVTNKTISKWETGRNLPDIEMIGKIALLFNVSVDEILTNRKTLGKKTKRLVMILFIELLLFMILLFVQKSVDNVQFIINLAFPNVLSLLSASLTSCFICKRNIFIKCLRVGSYGYLIFYNLLLFSVVFSSGGIGVFLEPGLSISMIVVFIIIGIIIGM